MLGLKEESFEYFDIICLNRYYGWYAEPGQIDLACQKLDEELEKLFEIYKKPMILSEFRAGAKDGCSPPEEDMDQKLSWINGILVPKKIK